MDQSIFINRVFCRKVYIHYTLSIVFAAMLISCVDDKIIATDSDSINPEISGDAITLYISPGSGFETRATPLSDIEKNENTVGKFRAKFFEAATGNDYFLFDSEVIGSKSMEQIEDKDGNILYKATIDIGNLKDNEGNSITNKVRVQLKDHPFKVVLIVNMPNEGRTAWSFDNSYFNSDKSKCKTIHDLHYLRQADDNYKDYYPFLLKDGNISDYVGWVTQRDISEDYNVAEITPDSKNYKTDKPADANKWIRKYWDPYWDWQYLYDNTSGNRKPVYRFYSNLWKLWNFGEGFEDNKISYDELWGFGETDVKDENTNEETKTRGLYEKWIERWEENQISGTIFSNNTILQTNELPFKGINDNVWDDLEIISPASNPVKSYNSDYYHGIILPKANQTTANTKTYLPTDGSQPCIKINIESSGHLRFKYSSLGNGNSSDRPNIVVQRGQEILDENANSYNTVPQDSKEIEVKITGDPEFVYIYNTSETKAVIYAIEFISDIYLSDTDRQGVSQNIAMVGVQKYMAFGTWANGETKDLIDQPVSLIRSVAKVVLNLPKEAKYVYMRSMNRSANIEPVDLSISTSDSWSSQHLNGENGCEWFNIQSYTPKYGNDNTYFTNWLKWYYGSWKNRMDLEGSDFSNIPSNPKNPQIFNQRIDRSDFCEFLYAGQRNGGYEYILYVPEKAVADPNDFDSSKNPSQTPKVIHIEYRYDNNSNNLDDNNCYRVYFTNYSDSSNPIHNVPDQNSYEDYEKNFDYLNYHWPIMRNHIYRFNVKANDGNSVRQIINARIIPWGYSPDSSWEEYW